MLLHDVNQHYSVANLTFVAGTAIVTPTRPPLLALEPVNSSKYECEATLHTTRDQDGSVRGCQGIEDFITLNTPQDSAFDLMVHIVSFAQHGWLGYAFPPWWDESMRGRVFLAHRAAVPESEFSSTLAHEIGHALGLYHVFEEDADQRECNACNELVGDSAAIRDHRGDFCSDTLPVSSRLYPEANGSSSCYSAPTYDECSLEYFPKVHNTNVMSYAPSRCKGAGSPGFTSQQVARMRCWLASGAIRPPPRRPAPPARARLRGGLRARRSRSA